MTPELISRFSTLVGKENAITDKRMLKTYLIEPRGLYNGATPLVLRPANTAEVSAIMKLASETKTPVVPQGGNTGLVGAQQPDQSGTQLVMSFSRMNQIRSIDSLGKIALVEAGVVLKTLREKALDLECFFPLSLASEGTAQIGGTLSTNAGGTAVLSYGNMRELCLGLEVVLPDGRVLDDLRGVRKDNSGYDLKNLFVGSEGTLGVITTAAMKLFALPRGRIVAYVGIQSPTEALKLFVLAQSHAGIMLTGFELMSRLSMQFSLAYNKQGREPLPELYPWYLLIEISSPCSQGEARNIMETILSESMKDGISKNAVIAINKAQEEAFWRLREDMSPAQKPEGISIKHDISVPIAAVPDFLVTAGRVIDEMLPGARVIVFGHIGDGNLHYNISQPIGANKEEFLCHSQEISHRIYALVMQYGGAFSAEHGIGQMKRNTLMAFKPSIAVDLMCSIKRLFDPHGIMNPEKVLSSCLFHKKI
ncbi:MAG: FAD/FMN-containing dehydrogenase [Candidatus Tokpelaia sp. JSC188]|nr:MAG: FAD/FMN-containing dehydrogenase [Candidatus Tokpelaia sp. JSC188]